MRNGMRGKIPQREGIFAAQWDDALAIQTQARRCGRYPQVLRLLHKSAWGRAG